MTKEAIKVENAPAPSAPYSQAMKVGNIVYTSGTVGFDPVTGKTIQGGIKAQAEQTLKNLDAILHGANTSLKNAIKVNVYLRSIDNFVAFNEVYKNFIDTETPPARTTVEVGPFAVADLLVEIDVIAFISD